MAGMARNVDQAATNRCRGGWQSMAVLAVERLAQPARRIGGNWSLSN
jgi:hypothetical protein